MLDSWITTDADNPLEPDYIYRHVLEMLSIKMRLTVIRLGSPDPWDWHLIPVRHSGFTSSLLDINHAFREQKLRDFKDRNYMAQSVIPRLKQVAQTQQPVIELVKTKLFGINIGYDRVLIPQRNRQTPEWIISSSYGRFMLAQPQNFGAFDLDEESIIQLLVEGRTAKEIGLQLGLSHRTVEHRLERLKERLGARNTVHLVAMILGSHIEN